MSWLGTSIKSTLMDSRMDFQPPGRETPALTSFPFAKPSCAGKMPHDAYVGRDILLETNGGEDRVATTAMKKRPYAFARFLTFLSTAVLSFVPAVAAEFDAAPFALPLPGGNGLLWEEPREIHKVVVEFDGPAPAPGTVHLEYWGSRWPEQRLPKDREPGGGDVGWMELGNWYTYKWRPADAESKTDGSRLTFAFRPVNQTEFPEVKDYPAQFRYTFKLRVRADSPLPKITGIQAFTDSTLQTREVTLAFQKKPSALEISAFNGAVRRPASAAESKLNVPLTIECSSNPDPNTFDRTLVTVRSGSEIFTFAVDDLKSGPLFIPALRVAVLPEGDARDYAAVAAEQEAKRGATIYDRVGEMPEQTWRSAWDNMPPKKSQIYFPMGLDGGRQRFLLQPNGTIQWRHNDHFLKSRPGSDTPRLELEAAPARFSFGPARQAVDRFLDEDSIPICTTTWEDGGLRTIQTAFVAELAGTKTDGPVPPADALAVCLARFTFTNTSSSSLTAKFPLAYKAGDDEQSFRIDDKGLLWLGDRVRGQLVDRSGGIKWPSTSSTGLQFPLAPGESKTILLKIPYLLLTDQSEQNRLVDLDFDSERKAVAGYWHRRLAESARLITPEPVLNDFYKADAGHLLINCEREPNSTRRFARVGSFSYGAYGNESCMMVVDLDRRGYHREAQECLDAWLHYQGTVGLPGDFSSKEGVFYGAGGYEAGGYNQHHGWILWMMAEHYRFTRDRDWLRSAAPGIVAGVDWILRETKRTDDRHPLERGLLPAGCLEDIGDWWTWLSTSCYMWRGLDSAAWALEQINHPETKRIRQAAEDYHRTLLQNFRVASERSPVVRLRDGTAVPKIPSNVHRRGRSFGWVCETLEGSMHLLITGALDPHSREAAWIINDYEDNLYLSNQYGYVLDDFEKHWFSRGGMSMQACLLLNVEPYLYRDDVKHALRAIFNAIAVSHFPDVHMNTEHALPQMGDWRGDHYKSSDESNACGWLRFMFVREDGDRLLVGQAIPREWLKPGQKCGVERTVTHFGVASVLYTCAENQITAKLDGPTRNPPKEIRVRFRAPNGGLLEDVTVNGSRWRKLDGDWVILPGTIGSANIVARY